MCGVHFLFWFVLLLCKYKPKRNHHSRCFIFFCHHIKCYYILCVCLSFSRLYFNWCNRVTVHRLSLVIHGICILFFIRHSVFSADEWDRKICILEFFSWKIWRRKKLSDSEVCRSFHHRYGKNEIFHSNICTHQQHIFRSIWFSAYDTPSPFICMYTCICIHIFTG